MWEGRADGEGKALQGALTGSRTERKWIEDDQLGKGDRNREQNLVYPM